MNVLEMLEKVSEKEFAEYIIDRILDDLDEELINEHDKYIMGD